MGKILVIAEKPSVGRDIARVLGCKEKADGCITGERYIVTWAMGHLVELLMPEDYDDKYKKWSLDDLPIIPEPMKIKPVKKTIKQFNIIKTNAFKRGRFFNMCDRQRPGRGTDFPLYL